MSTDVLGPLALSPAITQRRPISEHIAESLRDAIRSGQMPDGTELNQVVLAQHYGVSRIPIREALTQLQAEGFITLKLHQRALVRGMSNDRVAEILEIRTTLEASLMERAVENVTDEMLVRLTACCDEMEATTDHTEWLAGNARFHHELYAGAHRPATLELLAQLSTQVERYVRSNGFNLARQREAEREHRAIVEAMRAGQADTARALLRDHIGHTLRRFRENVPVHERDRASAS